MAALAGNSTVWLQQAGGKANHQQDEQQYGQADPYRECLDGAFRSTLVFHQEKQTTEETADDGNQKQDNNDFCDHGV